MVFYYKIYENEAFYLYKKITWYFTIKFTRTKQSNHIISVWHQKIYGFQSTNFFLIAIAMTAMLIGATALATDSAFAVKKKYEKNQAISQANACGNGFLPENVFCQNHASQIQGDENIVTLTGAQENG
jgi:hypothetical protein